MDHIATLLEAWEGKRGARGACYNTAKLLKFDITCTFLFIFSLNEVDKFTYPCRYNDIVILYQKKMTFLYSLYLSKFVHII